MSCDDREEDIVLRRHRAAAALKRAVRLLQMEAPHGPMLRYGHIGYRHDVDGTTKVFNLDTGEMLARTAPGSTSLDPEFEPPAGSSWQ